MTEPIKLTEDQANILGFVETEATEQIDSVLEQIEAEVVEQVQESVEEQVEVTVVTETEEEIEIPEISTQEVVVEAQKVEPEVKVQTTPKKVKAFANEYVAALNNYVSTVENPDVNKFNTSWHSDYSKVPPLEMIRIDILNDPYNKDLDPDAIEALMEERISKYNIYSDDEREKRIGESLLMREANIIKDKLTKSGKEFVNQYMSDLEIEVETFEESNPEPVVDEAAIQAQRDAIKAEFVDGFAKVVSDGVIQMKDSVSGDMINIPAANIEDLAELALTFKSKFENADGTTNYQKLARFLNYANNEDAIHSAWFKHGFTSASKKITSQLKNKVDVGQARPVESQSEVTPWSDPVAFLQGAKVIRR